MAKKKPCVATKPRKRVTATELLQRAGKRRHASLLKRLQQGDTLTSGEQKELLTLEAARKAKRSPTRVGQVTIPTTQREILVSTNDQVGAVFAVDGRTVQNWKRDETWPDTKRGPYNLAVIGRWRAEKLKRPVDHSEELQQITLEAAREKMLFRRARRKQEEAEAFLRSGELLPASDVVQWFPQIFAPMSTYLQGMIGRHPEERKQTKKVVAEIRRQWAERNQEGEQE